MTMEMLTGLPGEGRPTPGPQSQPITPERALLRDVLEMLHVVSEWAEDQADIRDNDGCPTPNRAMRIGIALDGNDYEPGLIARVSQALEQSK